MGIFLYSKLPSLLKHRTKCLIIFFFFFNGTDNLKVDRTPRDDLILLHDKVFFWKVILNPHLKIVTVEYDTKIDHKNQPIKQGVTEDKLKGKLSESQREEWSEIEIKTWNEVVKTIVVLDNKFGTRSANQCRVTSREKFWSWPAWYLGR